MEIELIRLKSKLIQLIINFGLIKKCSVFIIGTQKSGTTELHSKLLNHPKLVSSFKKEVHFFSSEQKFNNRGILWYQSQFPKIPFWSDKLLIEATPSYIFFPRALERIKRYNPKARLVVLLRNPIKRAYSSWNMFSSTYKKYNLNKALIEERTFEEAIGDELHGKKTKTEYFYLKKGIYVDQLIELFKIFDRNQILIIQSEKYWENKDYYEQVICDFLGIKAYKFEDLSLKYKAEGSYKNDLSQEMHEKLKDYYKSHNQRLEKLLGEEVSWS